MDENYSLMEESHIKNQHDVPLKNATTGEYQELRFFLNDHMHHEMTTCVAFDSYEQLFWAGTQSVRIILIFSICMNSLDDCLLIINSGQ